MLGTGLVFWLVALQQVFFFFFLGTFNEFKEIYKLLVWVAPSTCMSPNFVRTQKVW